MKSFFALISLLALQGVSGADSSIQELRTQQKLDMSGDTAYLNFIKVMSGILITMPEPPKEITSAVKVVMRELFNGEPAKQGYFSYLTTSVLRVFDSPLRTQVDTMFGIIIMMSDSNSPISGASRIVQDFMASPKAYPVYEDIEKFITNLFQPAITNGPTPTNQLESGFDMSFLGRPASGRHPSNPDRRQ